MKKNLLSILLTLLFPLLLSSQEGVLPKSFCESLKTKFQTHSYTTLIQDVEAFYSGNTLFTAIGQISGGFRGISHEHPPAWFSGSDETLVKAWTDPELLNWVVQKVQYEDRTFSTYLAVSRKCVLTVGGINFEGVQTLGVLSQNQADFQAFALAVVAMMNYASFNSLRN